MSVDPVVRQATTAQSFNAYSYVENNPISGVDPSGMSLCPPSTACDTLVGYASDGSGNTYSLSQAQGLVDSAQATFGGKFTEKGLEAAKGIVAAANGPASGVAAGAAAAPSGTPAPPDVGPGGSSQSGGTSGGDPWQGVEEMPVTGNPIDQHIASGGEVFNVYPDSYSNWVAMNGRWDAITAGMVASMNLRPSPQPSPTGTQPDVQMRSMVGALNFLASFPISPTNGNWLTFQGGMIFVGGAGLLLAGGAIALGVGTAAAGVSAAGLGILGVGAMAIGGTQMMLGREIAGGGRR